MARYQLTLYLIALLFATHLAAQDETRRPQISAATAPAPDTIAERLSRKVTLQSRQTDLALALQDVERQIGVPIRIVGEDLKFDGITKHQRLSMDVRDVEAESVLAEIVKLANPVRGLKSVADVDQKLVYVIDDKNGEILITIRSRADSRGTLPTVFQVPVKPSNQ